MILENLINEFTKHLIAAPDDGYLTSNDRARIAFERTIKENFEQISYRSQIHIDRPKDFIESMEKRATSEAFYNIAQAIEENNCFIKTEIPDTNNGMGPVKIIRHKILITIDDRFLDIIHFVPLITHYLNNYVHQLQPQLLT